MKLLITGALGHIGSRFTHTLEPNAFDEVCLLDNLSTQRYPSLLTLPRDINFSFLEKDITSANLELLFENVDVVIHLAAITDATASVNDPINVEEVNYLGTDRVARACANSGTVLIFPSTTSVYGSNRSIVDENCTELNPQSPYAESKIKAEKLLIDIGHASGLKFTTLRLGTIFGSSIGMRFHTAVNKFCWQATLGQPIQVWRTAYEQMRPYLGINDACRVLNFVIKNTLLNGDIYNVVSSNTTVKHIIDVIRERYNNVEIEFVDSPIMNQLSYEVSSKRIEAHGFLPKEDIRTGILDTLSFLEHLRPLKSYTQSTINKIQ